MLKIEGVSFKAAFGIFFFQVKNISAATTWMPFESLSHGKENVLLNLSNDPTSTMSGTPEYIFPSAEHLHDAWLESELWDVGSNFKLTSMCVYTRIYKYI